MPGPLQTMYVVGAGFSFHAGLPLATNFADELLNLRGLKLDGPSPAQVEYLRKFVSDIYGHDVGTPGADWPELADLFTIVDLAANTGHNLAGYSASELRTVRRALIARTIRMLSRAYTKGRDTGGPRWKALEAFFARVEARRTGFLSMNWDMVIERGLESAHGNRFFDYGCGAVRSVLKAGELQLAAAPDEAPTVLKPHGSINWFYCDACRAVLYVDASRAAVVAAQLFREGDWGTVDSAVGRKQLVKRRPCPRCGKKALSVRFVTFSYRKALDFPMHHSTWSKAEQLLFDAENWVFMGYSLPAADYDFKYLLKRVQVARERPPRIVVVTGGNDTSIKETTSNYRRLFGESIVDPILTTGLEGNTLDELGRIGALKKRA
ncbi:MAG: hypothetical protein ACJ8D6_04860 [Sphingomicrobium sp.]